MDYGRIAEIADRCNVTVNTFEGYSEMFDPYRFAELIIQECAAFVNEWETYQLDMANPCNGNFPIGGSVKLKEHFGIKKGN